MYTLTKIIIDVNHKHLQTLVFHILLYNDYFFDPEIYVGRFSVSWNPFLLKKIRSLSRSMILQAESVMKLVDSNGDVTGGFTTGSTVVMSWGATGKSSYNP